MPSQPPSPAAPPASSQQHGENNDQTSSSPHSRADSAVHIDETPEKPDPDSSFQSNTSERHPKGKRKRTAAKDKAILEAAYNANPKPDKAARLDIVKRVSLNEKEVQIWFQNRRQNDRRKSRPLSPQEIAALQYGGMQVLSDSAPYTNTPPASSLPTSSLSTTNASPAPRPSLPEKEHASPPSIADPTHPTSSEEKPVEPADVVPARRDEVSYVGTPVGQSAQPVELTAGRPHQLHRSSSVGYFANRLHAGASFQPDRRSPDSYRHEFMPATRPSSTAPSSLLPPPNASKFRLSMSVEGKAELVSQPSPPRLSPSAISDGSVASLDRPHLHRSYSAAGCITLPPISTLTASLETSVAPPTQVHTLQQPQPRLPPRLYRSRSRDVHAWEMACEANSVEHRDELTAYAERESSGSAIAAISLLRSLSSNSHSSIAPGPHFLQSSCVKRNARPSAHQHHSHSAKKPKLGRASSSIGRLQTNLANPVIDKLSTRRDHGHGADDLKKAKTYFLTSTGENDSDKENWSPSDENSPAFRGSQRTSSGRRPLPSGPSSKTAPSFAPHNDRRRALVDSTNRTMLGRSSTAPTSRRRKAGSPIEIFEDGGEDADDEDQSKPTRSGVVDDEVEKFMRGEVSPSKKGAASAIAGLLALSQGNWR